MHKSLQSKRISLISFFLVLVVGSGQSQERENAKSAEPNLEAKSGDNLTAFARTPKGQFNGVVRVGVVTSHIYNDDFGGWNKLGATGGVGIFTQITRNWKFQFELDYAMRGSRKRATNQDPGTYRIEPHYIDIPLLLKTRFWILEAEIGINNGLYLFHFEADESGRLFQDQYGWRFNRYEIAGLAGFNVAFTDKLVGNVRFHYSILPAAGESFAVVGGRLLTGGAYNNAISFSLHRLLFQKR